MEKPFEVGDVILSPLFAKLYVYLEHPKATLSSSKNTPNFTPHDPYYLVWATSPLPSKTHVFLSTYRFESDDLARKCATAQWLLVSEIDVQGHPFLAGDDNFDSPGAPGKFFIAQMLSSDGQYDPNGIKIAFAQRINEAHMHPAIYPSEVQLIGKMVPSFTWSNNNGFKLKPPQP